MGINRANMFCQNIDIVSLKEHLNENKDVKNKIIGDLEKATSQLNENIAQSNTIFSEHDDVLHIKKSERSNDYNTDGIGDDISDKKTQIARGKKKIANYGEYAEKIINNLKKILKENNEE